MSAEDLNTIILLSIPVCFVALLLLLFRISVLLDDLSKREGLKKEREMIEDLKEDGFLGRDVLPVGLYHPTEEDANEYVMMKAEEIPAARFDPYSTWDWRIDGEAEEG